MRVVSQVLAPAFALLALETRPAWPSPATEPPTDLQFIVSEAQKVQKADVAAWSRYQFGRRSEREDYDDSGQIVGRDDLEFVVTPDGDGFREELVRHNGAAALASERDQERRSGSFNKHYRTLVAGDEGHAESGYSLGQLLHLSSYRFMGQEVLNGVALDVRTYEFATLYTDVQAGHFQLYFLQWTGGQLVIQRDSGNQFCDKEVNVLLRIEVVDGFDIRMIEAGKGQRFFA